MVRTRFAPSPTGYLHIGGVRTALFNWLFARKHGGQFILRIDDTDQQRNVAEALAPILHGFRWLGLDWDEGAEVGGPHEPYYQSQKLERYQAAVRELVVKGAAYWDYATADEMKAEMEAAEKEKRPKIYSRRWMAATAADRARFEAEGRAGSVRLKMPRDGSCRFADHIRGDVEVKWASEQDIVIQRSDGTVTYNLANVVDDFDMKISHVIRAEEHLSNTPRQIFMLEALGYPRPEYAHLPFVAEPGSKNKLSKRKIANYLKNPDFKKVYEHGNGIAHPLVAIQVAAKVQEFLETMKAQWGDGYTPVFEKQVSQALLHLISRIGTGLTLEKASETDEQMAKVVWDKAREYWEDSELLKRFEHGQGILRKLGFTLPAETFNPVVLDFYRQVGYLPDAIINYLMLLGWAHEDGKSEYFTRDEMIRLFSLDRVNKAPASLDVKKLFAFQEHYFQGLTVAERVEKVLPFLVRAGLLADPVTDAARALVTKIVTEAGPRMIVAGDILNYEEFFVADDVVRYDEKAVEKHLKKDPSQLPKLRELVSTTNPFDAPTLRKRVEEFAQAAGVKPGAVSQTLRVAVTGKDVGFDAYGSLAILGRERCLFRIDRALGRLA